MIGAIVGAVVAVVSAVVTTTTQVKQHKAAKKAANQQEALMAKAARREKADAYRKAVASMQLANQGILTAMTEESKAKQSLSDLDRLAREKTPFVSYSGKVQETQQQRIESNQQYSTTTMTNRQTENVRDMFRGELTHRPAGRPVTT